MVRLTRIGPLLYLSAAIWSGSACGQSPPPSLRTSVLPLAGDDIARPCEYELATPLTSEAYRAVFVIFERGQDIQHLYSDPRVRSFAERHHLAMMMPGHCASKKYEDIDIDPTKGLGRALFIASISSPHRRAILS